MPEQELINKIRELKQKLKELDTQITAKERELHKCYSVDQEKAERLQIEDLKGKKDEAEKEKSHLQEKAQLQAKLEKKEKKLKEYTNQINDLNESNEQSLKEIAVLQAKINDLNREIGELKERVKEMDHKVLLLNEEIKQNEFNHKNRIECINAEHKQEITDLIYESKTKIEQQNTTHLRELDEYRKSNNFLEDQVQDLKTKNLKMQDDLKEYKKYASYCAEEDKHLIYIVQICSDIQNNWYRYVIPQRVHVENRTYNVENIIDDIKDSTMLSKEEQIEAKRRWECLKRQINWNREKNQSDLLQLMTRLRNDRNEAAHPKDLTKEGAKTAAAELNKQGKLHMKPSHNDVLKVIDLWVSSKSL